MRTRWPTTDVSGADLAQDDRLGDLGLAGRNAHKHELDHLRHSSASKLVPDDSCWTAPDSYRAPCHAALRLVPPVSGCTVPAPDLRRGGRPLADAHADAMT